LEWEISGSGVEKGWVGFKLHIW